jgi:hypothetical protein
MNEKQTIAPGQAINCLRCRHCKLLPHSKAAMEQSYDAVPIFCRRLKRNWPMQLAPCPHADPRPYRARDARKGNPRATGDFVKGITGVERVFLRVHYPRANVARLVALTGRDAGTLRALCNRMGVFKEAAAVKHGRQWPHPQRAYIASCINSSFWPKRGFGAKTARAQQIREEIVARVAELGPARSWLEIRKYAKSLTPAYFARAPRKVARHRELQNQKRERRIAAMSDEERAAFERRSQSSKSRRSK